MQLSRLIKLIETPLFDANGSLAIAFSQAPFWVKIGVFFTIWGLLWVPIAIPLARGVQWRWFSPLKVQQKLPLVASLYLIAPIVLWGISRLEHASFSTYGWVWNGQLFRLVSLGIAAGAIGLLILFGVQIAFGWLSLKFENWRGFAVAALPTFGLGLFVGGVEELVFRGFLFGQLLIELDFWTAAIGSSGIFALLHLIWDGKEGVSQLPGLWLMGVILCLAFTISNGNIGLAWGLHAGWVWMIAALDASEILNYPTSAPEWLIGLQQKPLAGLLGLLFLLGTGFGLIAAKSAGMV